MNVLTNKAYKQSKRLSRYSSFPYYYNTLDNKYIEGFTKYLKDTTVYSVHKVAKNDTWDSLALYYYNNPTYYWIILSYNHIQDPFVEPVENTLIKIPAFSNIEFEEL